MLSAYIRRFHEAADAAVRSCDRCADAIELKRRHSLRVLEEARALAADLGLDAQDAFFIHLAALFHDIGRFSQVERFGTFNDARSLNHARESVLTLRRGRVLADLPAAARRRVAGAIYLHNYAVLPSGLPPLLDRDARVLRDADKLDITHLVLSHFEGAPAIDEGIYLGLEPDPARYTPQVAEQALAGQVLRLEFARYVNDYLIFLSSWIYDLNFPYSRDQFHRRGYLQRIFSLLPDTPQLQKLGEQLEGRFAPV